jgi:hypothetical protein
MLKLTGNRDEDRTETGERGCGTTPLRTESVEGVGARAARDNNLFKTSVFAGLRK